MIRRISRHLMPWRERMDKLVADNEKLREALEPFAKMHRENDRPGELALTRGRGYEASYLFSEDFEQADRVLKETA